MSQDTSKKAPIEWRILQGRKESFIQDMTFAAPVGKELNESMVEQIDLAISKSAYEELKQQALLMREALARYKGLCVHWDENHHETCGRPADRALEQFDEFMKESK